MVSKRRGGLGSGLGALIPASASPDLGVREVAVGAIRPNRSQPRQAFNEQALAELAASIQEHGVIQPLLVTAHDDGTYELIAGERRWRASQLAGLTHVPVLVRESTPQRLLELALVENIQRADLNPIEEGRAYQSLKDEFGLSDEQIARRVGKGRVVVANARRLLNLVPAAQQALLDGTITAGHGRAVLMLDRPEQQEALLALIRGNSMSVRAAESVAALVNDAKLDPRAQAALLQGTITIEQAQAILRTPVGQTQAEVIDVLLLNGLGVRETERLCDLVLAGATPAAAIEALRPQQNAMARTAANPSPQRGADTERSGGVLGAGGSSPEDDEVVRLLEQATGTPVQLVRSGKTIRVTFTLYSEEALDGLYEKLAGG